VPQDYQLAGAAIACRRARAIVETTAKYFGPTFKSRAHRRLGPGGAYPIGHGVSKKGGETWTCHEFIETWWHHGASNRLS